MTKDIIAVQPLADFRLSLTFEGGEQREVSIAHLVPFDGVFAPLVDEDYFRKVRVNPEIGTIVWPNGADLCPDVLYDQGAPVKRASETAEST